MDENKDLAEKIYWILVEEGQHNLKFPLGSIITNTPDEVRDIIRKHINEIRSDYKEKIIKLLQEEFSVIWDCDINHRRFEDTVEEILTEAVEIIIEQF